MFLVVTLHSAVAYITHDMPGVLWCVRDAPTIGFFEKSPSGRWVFRIRCTSRSPGSSPSACTIHSAV